ncbi:hypothetical protein EXQ31_06030 [Clostridium botulinum]|uniref:hypothetical protein n=1 Tax=Clostridium botulinum TaxID=1491 RepID=UPI001A925E72|nr:hypothetical protein [Clostridium botulinum]MBO0526020.1 hypothetical protein [Clostridium botulinum]MBO0528278.1 hypothetical protein [Clostridium botulinum]MBO0531047.1 hypothetical protein [Clostridium botulinum]MBO0535098.1 hypothetical protein [Clostridium botulinum]MBO0539007.1 hypothetical protein [Clostridium botulinum]
MNYFILSIFSSSAAIKGGYLTAYEKEQWQQSLKEYILKVLGIQKVLLDCGHYIHDYEYERIVFKRKEFIKSVILVK